MSRAMCNRVLALSAVGAVLNVLSYQLAVRPPANLLAAMSCSGSRC